MKRKNALFIVLLMFSAVLTWAGPSTDRHRPRFQYSDSWIDNKGREQRTERKFSSVDELSNACYQDDFRACKMLADHYTYNKQAQKASAARNQMINLYQKDCAKGTFHTCELLARYYYGNNQKQKAIALYKKNCDLGDEGSCLELSTHYSMQKDKVNTFYYQKREFEILCRKGHLDYCLLWREMKKLSPDSVTFH